MQQIEPDTGSFSRYKSIEVSKTDPRAPRLKMFPIQADLKPGRLMARRSQI